MAKPQRAKGVYTVNKYDKEFSGLPPPDHWTELGIKKLSTQECGDNLKISRSGLS
jgi:hypothetical protein